jgi:creatinine amidohydrolase
MLEAARTPWTDVAARLRGGVAVLPFGALEQHGPHLPLATDTLTAEAVARRLAERIDGVLLPALPYGDTWNNAGYPGTVGLATSTVLAIATDIGRAVAGAGAALFVVVNGDWGNRLPLAQAMRTLSSEGIRAIALDYPGMDDAIAELRESRPAAPGLNHAEEVETSIVLAIDPDLVHRERYTAEYPDFPADFGTRPMQLHPFSQSGVFGDPATATAAKGEEILARTVEASLAVLTDLLPHRGSQAS